MWRRKKNQSLVTWIYTLWHIMTGIRGMIVLQCGKVLKTLKKLQTHHRLHTSEKPFECSRCHNSVTCRHTRCHILERGKFYCPDWGKSFSLSDHLNTHIMTHSREKGYNCTQCGKSFTRYGSLKRHKMTHSREKGYDFPQCQKSFSQSGNLKTRKVSHTGEKPFDCPHCE